MPMNPKDMMMDAGQNLGVGSLMSEDFKNRDKSMYQPLVDADVSNLMSEDFQNRDKSKYQPLADSGNNVRQLLQMLQANKGSN